MDLRSAEVSPWEDLNRRVGGRLGANWLTTHRNGGFDMSIRPGNYSAKRIPKVKVTDEYLEVDDDGNCLLIRSLSYEYRDPYGDPFLTTTTLTTFHISQTQARKWLDIQNLPDDSICLGTPDEL